METFQKVKIYDIKLHRSFLIELDDVDFARTGEFRFNTRDKIILKVPVHGDSLLLNVTPRVWWKVWCKSAFTKDSEIEDAIYDARAKAIAYDEKMKNKIPKRNKDYFGTIQNAWYFWFEEKYGRNVPLIPISFTTDRWMLMEFLEWLDKEVDRSRRNMV